ncbi:MAG TPA: NADP-dependent phosphogluconate dehydrogenase [Bacteroidota bacterium]|nr:NADP-dependent phosphogluconate dehydrogenase [Bacteroidota bacterium]
MDRYHFGVVGLGVMGQNLARNLERNGFSVVGYDADGRKVDDFARVMAGKAAAPARSAAEFIASLEPPRRILMMVPAGKPVDAVINDLKGGLSSGDILIDGGNSFFADTERRLKSLEGTGILYVGTGVSGGEEGALRGPSIMPGGNPAAWPLLKAPLQAIAAKTDDGVPCCDWIGKGGAGHFVKMVHNGIEYGDMQIICEAYFLMSRLLGMTPPQMADVFAEWDRGELNSYLIQITAEILRREDPETGKPIVDVILDTAEQKGTGKWTGQVALDLGVPALTIADAVFARTLSALKKERVAASAVLKGPQIAFAGDKTVFLELIRKALLCSKICSYAQGFQLLRAADAEYGWGLNFGRISLLWRAGCIIRARFLGKINDAYGKNPSIANLLLDPWFSGILTSYQAAWRNVIAAAVTQGIPVPAFTSALAYFDSYRSASLPANLLQAQRDYFGAHTYRRNDREVVFHTKWEEA